MATKTLIAIRDETGITAVAPMCEDCGKFATQDLFGVYFCEDCAPKPAATRLLDWYDDKWGEAYVLETKDYDDTFLDVQGRR
jgi:hypothetical protein